MTDDEIVAALVADLSGDAAWTVYAGKLVADYFNGGWITEEMAARMFALLGIDGESEPDLDCDWWPEAFGRIWRENRPPARGTSPAWDRMRRLVEIEGLLREMGLPDAA